VGAVEVGRAVAAAQVERVVAVVEEAQSALLVEGMGPGVGDARLEAVADALFDVRLQGVVGIHAGGFVGDGLSRVADVGNAQVAVAAFVVGLVAGAVGQGEGP
jgi:hypothetical protein